MRRALSWFGVAFLGLAVAVALLVALLLQSAPGQRFVLRTALNVVEGQIQGTLQVGGIRSAGLLRGFTLDRVVLADREGRPFLEADSIRVGYSVRGFLARDATLEPLELHRPRVTIETLPGDSVANVARIFAPAEPRPDDAVGEPPDFRLVLRRARIEEGSLRVRAGDAETRVESIEGRIREAVVLDPRAPGESFDFQSLSLVLHFPDVGEGPLRVENFEGLLRREGAGLVVQARELALAGTHARGGMTLSWEEELVLDLALDVDRFDARDLAWLEPRIPEATGHFRLAATGPLATSRWRITEAELSAEGGRHQLSGDAGVALGESLRLFDTRLQGTLFLDLLDPWLEEPLPVEGRLQAQVRLSGPLTALEVDGEVTFDDPARGIPASTARVRGSVNPEAATVAGLSLVVEPLRLETLQALELDLRGGGSLELEATGGLREGLELRASLLHATAAVDLSRISASGRVRQVGETFELALSTTFTPLSLDGVERALARELPVSGSYSGELELAGLLTDLSARGWVETPGGRVDLEARMDATDPARGYRLEGETRELALSAFVRAAPEDAHLTGRFQVEGEGFDPATLQARGRLGLEESRWGEIVLHEGVARAWAEEGVLHLDTLELRAMAGRFQGAGDLALAADAPRGRLAVDWELEDLSDLRPFLLGEAPMDPDTLSALELELLRFDGIEVAPESTVPLRGSVRGQLLLEGGLDDLQASVVALGEGLAWREAEVTTLEVDARARMVTDTAGVREVRQVEAWVDLEEALWGRFDFQRLSLDAWGELASMQVAVDLERDRGESYHTAGRVEREGTRITYHVRELDFALEGGAWNLVRSSRITWDEGVIQVDDLEVARPGNGEAVRIVADGSLDLDGPLQMRARAERVDLERLGGILQLDPSPRGALDLELELTGTAASPRIAGNLRLEGLEVVDTRFSLIEGTVDYADESAQLHLEVEQGGERIVTASGSWPVNLALGEVETRLPSRPVELVLEVNELPAATALAPLEVLEEVEGVLNGRIEFRGEPTDLRPSGELRLAGGRFALPEIGLRPGEVEAHLVLSPDGSVAVEARGRSVGPVEIEGTVDLSNLLDPAFDLRVQAQGFQAVNRRDLEGRVSGTIFLRGRYMEPRVTGSIRVDQANLFLEEFARTATVVDLSDPAFLAAVDTTLAAARRVAEAAQNPFIENLRVDADLSIQRDVWLRSREMNVEVGGDLIVTFDRSDREILLVGQVEAVRGNYNAFGRQFQVRGGTVDFVGTPGINPALNIEAVHRLRQQGGDPLDIVATLEGTLLDLRISLSSEGGVNIAESDLISYLIFGRPSYALASAESRMLGDAAISAGIGAAAGQLSSLLGQQIGLDFFNITQAQDQAGLGALRGEGLVDTQVELGQYLTDNVFLALVLRPLRGIGGSQAQVPGARVEWRFTDLWTFNAYVEDRFGREGVFTFGEAGLQVNRVFGLELFREWGY